MIDRRPTLQAARDGSRESSVMPTSDPGKREIVEAVLAGTMSSPSCRPARENRCSTNFRPSSARDRSSSCRR